MKTIAHELRTPLTAIKWIFEELKKDSLTSDERKELVRLGSLATMKLSKIIDSLNHAAKESFVNLNELILKVAQEEEPVARQYGVQIHTNCSQDEIMVKGDIGELETALSNLIINAIKYNKKGGSVTVLARELVSERKAEVVVEDTGRGMNPKETGFGLSIVEKIIKKHKGRIWVDSVLGKGSKFHFVLPTRVK